MRRAAPSGGFGSGRNGLIIGCLKRFNILKYQNEMDRGLMLKQLDDADKVWDVVVVGGGATGLGCAVDAATRGFSVALFEREDFAKCTSSRSTKLVHGGGVTCRKWRSIWCARALHERGIMKRNAPHLVSDQAFVISNYRYWDNFLYFCGLTFYDIPLVRLRLRPFALHPLQDRHEVSADLREERAERRYRIPRRSVRRCPHGMQPRADVRRERRMRRKTAWPWWA